MILFGVLFTMPTATSAIEQMGSWSSALFTEFSPLLWLIVGVAVFLLVFRIVGRLFHKD